MNPTKTAIIYARVSSSKQAEEELPIASQVDQCRQRAERLEANILKVFTDEGISGSTDSRAAFQDAIGYAEIECPDYFITWSSSRFARNKVDAGFYKKRLEAAGVRLTYVSVEVDTSTTEGWLLDGVFELFDELYSRQVSADTRRSLLKNAKEGFWNGGRLPFGFVAVPDIEQPRRKRLKQNPEESDIIQRIFEMKAFENIGSRGIAQWLNTRKILNRGKPWVKSTVLNLLRNESVIGKTVFGRRDKNNRIKPRDQWIIVETHEPLITIDLWNTVQQKLDLERDQTLHGSPKSHRYFTGILRCGECGALMHTESAKGRGRRYWYYNCSEAKKGNHKPRRLPTDDIDPWLIDVICDEILTADLIRETITELHQTINTWGSSKEKRRESIVARLRSLKQSQNNLYSLLEEFGKDVPNLSDLTGRLRSNNDQMKSLSEDLAKIDNERPPVLDITDQQIIETAQLLRSMVKTSEIQAVRAFFQTFIKEIIVHDTNIEMVVNPENLVNRHDLPVPSECIWLPDKALLGTKLMIMDLPIKMAVSGC